MTACLVFGCNAPSCWVCTAFKLVTPLLRVLVHSSTRFRFLNTKVHRGRIDPSPSSACVRILDCFVWFRFAFAIFTRFSEPDNCGLRISLYLRMSLYYKHML